MARLLLVLGAVALCVLVLVHEGDPLVLLPVAVILLGLAVLPVEPFR